MNNTLEGIKKEAPVMNLNLFLGTYREGATITITNLETQFTVTYDLHKLGLYLSILIITIISGGG
jgi:hypothetical protein